MIDYYDMGSGHMIDLPYGLDRVEPSTIKIMEHKPSLVIFQEINFLERSSWCDSGKELIAKIKKNHLLRMLRVDKLTLALQESLNLSKDEYKKIPTIAMLLTTKDELKDRANKLQNELKDICK